MVSVEVAHLVSRYRSARLSARCDDFSLPRVHTRPDFFDSATGCEPAYLC